ncbi:DUF533 domain-containing protein [Cognatishimia sp. MH4019]|uniref:DUF533 domain-containing protein n=1 Tax=Cognatishimia sp. MH4019 TaxID=2854030 RepID=UPI001CD5F174|nr:DUF533 domain-containing protein [Cognatishimia sp. MH4019]
MGLMGTLAKVAIGFAAAKGIEKMNQSGGLQGMMDQMSSGAQGGAGNLQDMMGQMMGGAQGGAQNLQDMMAKMMGGAGAGAGNLQDMMGQMMGGGAAPAESSDKGGLLANLGGAGGAGLAGILAMAGGAAAMGGDGMKDMLGAVGQEKASDEMEQNAGIMLRAIIQAAKADGDIDADEQARIMDTLGEDADGEDIAFVKAQLAAPVNVEGLAADTPNGMEAQVYAMSLMSIRVDTQAEVAYLTDLAGALRLPKTTLDMVHAQMGVPALPA